MNYKYIAIEGNIGAGKTALADKLADALGADTIHEQFEDNPFLESFYKYPEKNTFQLEEHFLYSRFNQLKNKNIYKRNKIVSDYYFGKSLVFAKNNLSGSDFDRFQKQYISLKPEIPEPDLIIYLRNDIHKLQENIRQRGRIYEQNIEDKYLKYITMQYDSFFKLIDDLPVLKVEIKKNDFVKDNFDFQKIIKLLAVNWPNGISDISL